MIETSVVEPKPPDGSVSPEGVIEQLRAAETLRCRVVFDEFRLAAELLRQRVCERIAAGVAQDRWQLGVAAEIGLALRISPRKAAVLLSRAVELERNMPHTRERLREGELSPEAIPVLISGLAHLEPVLRRQADAQLCADPATLEGLGQERVRGEVEKVAYELDRAATVERNAKAEKDRAVSIRPLPEGMARVSLLLPLAQAVGVYASVRRHAQALRGVADEARTLGQLMADTAFERLTGVAPSAQPVTVNLTMPAEVLLGGESGTAHLRGGGPVPAEIARRLVGRATAAGAAWVKRLYVAPESGAVVAMDSRQRFFPAGLAEVIAARDRYCRTPYCDAPIAHLDHVRPHAAGGRTSLANGQGLCAACNQAKEAHGWHAEVVPNETGRHTVETRTASGRVYRSTAPGQEVRPGRSSGRAAA